MRALFVGPGGSFVTACGKLLILHDNVQHHLQAGRATREYFWIHELAEMVVTSRCVSTSARELWAELAKAFARLRDVPIQDLAISVRTHVLFSGAVGPPVIQGTLLLRQTRWRSPVPTGRFSTLGNLFADVCRGIERTTTAGTSGALIEVSLHPTLVLVPVVREDSADEGTSAHLVQHDR